MAMRGDAIELRTVTQDALFVPDSMPAVQLLDSFRSSHKHMALVMDEFGAVEGVVTVTDMLEALVGHLPANATDAASVFVARADGSWLVEGSASMEEVMTRFALDQLPEEEAGAYHTLGGFVMARLGPRARRRRPLRVGRHALRGHGHGRPAHRQGADQPGVDARARRRRTAGREVTESA